MGVVVDIGTKEKSASVQYLGHASVIITSEKGKRIIIDPWLEGNPLCPDNLKDPKDIDAIVLTHGHSDHAASAVQVAKDTGADLFATYELALLMGKEGVSENKLHPMNKGGTVTLPGSNGIKITLTNAFHSSSFNASDGTTYYAGEACGAVITLESERTIYHAGDTCIFGDMRLIGELYEPQLALLPIGDCFTMDPLQAKKATELIKPKVVIPIHYKTFDLLTGSEEQFIELVKQTESEGVLLEPGSIYEF